MLLEELVIYSVANYRGEMVVVRDDAKYSVDICLSGKVGLFYRTVIFLLASRTLVQLYHFYCSIYYSIFH